eukprot:4405805-Alexandrium_andersonii.AAC.1
MSPQAPCFLRAQSCGCNHVQSLAARLRSLHVCWVARASVQVLHAAQHAVPGFSNLPLQRGSSSMLRKRLRALRARTW